MTTDDYAGYNALALQPGVERLACMAHARRKFVEAKVQLKGKTGRADVALAMMNKLYASSVNSRRSAMMNGSAVPSRAACRSSAS